MKVFPAMSREEVWWELPLSQGQAYYSWAIENDVWLAFNGIKRSSKGFVGKQVEVMMEQLSAFLKK